MMERGETWNSVVSHPRENGDPVIKLGSRLRGNDTILRIKPLRFYMEHCLLICMR